MAKIRVSNAKKQPVRVVLEPWALEWMLNPDDCLDFIAVTDGAQSEWFMVHVYDSTGKLVG